MPWAPAGCRWRNLRLRHGRADLAAAGVPTGLPGQLLRFAAVGIASTLAYLLLYALLRQATGAQAANLAALLVTAVANTAVNRRLTFGVRGTGRLWRHHAQGLAVFALSLGLTGGALALLHAADATPGRPLELAVLVVANLAATCARFLLLRAWVFGPPSDSFVAGTRVPGDPSIPARK